MEVRAWLGALGLERYADAFVEHDIDAEVLRSLTDADLVEIGVRSLGHRKRLLAAIAELVRTPAERGPSAAADAPPRTGGGERERSRGEAGPTSPLRAAARDPRATVDAHAHFEATAHVDRDVLSALRARGYVLVDRIGQGGMGEVYLARQTSVDREVAVKVLRARDTPGDRARFAREARAIAALDHPHCVRLFDYVLADGGGAAIVMEYVHGESLHALLAREGRVPYERIATILVQVCDALAEAHAKGIVHRDLKPANVLLQEAAGYREFAKVLDFGLARWASPDESRLTRTGTVYGTPRYLSPEQVLGSDIGPRSDLYSLGIVLWEALAGRPPFVADLDASLMFKHVKEPAPALPEDVARPPEVDRLLDRLLSKSTALRPASAAALRRELAATIAPVASEVRASAGPSDAPPSAPPSTERRRVVAIHVAFPPGRAGFRSHDDAHEALRARMARVDAIARRHGGFVAAHGLRDAQIVFGAPIARRDDEARALAAALALRDGPSGAETPSRPGAPAGESEPAADGAAPRPSIGVAQGIAIAGATSDSRGSTYLVSGAPLELAADLAARAGAGEILVSADLVERTGADHAYAAHGPDAEEPGAPALLVGTRDAPSDDAQIPFVGRTREIETLESVLEHAARDRRGRVVVIAGEAGIGKSRLVDRLRAKAHAAGWRCARGLVYDVEVARSEDALHRIVEELLDLPEDVSDRVSALERRLGPEALRPEQWPFLYHFVGVVLPGAMQRLYDAMEEPARREGYRDMLATLFAHESRAQPLLVVLEDVHWADPTTLDAIEALCARAESAPLVLVLTSRVEGEERWSHALHGHASPLRLELSPLGDSDALELAARLGVGEAVRQAVVVERAAGHPLLLTELARAREGEIEGALPHTIQALVHARLDRLPDRDRGAISAAAVLGPRFRLASLRAVLGDPEYVAARLVDWRLLRRDGDAAFGFVHALVRDAVYESLLDERRRALHARCAEVLRDDLVVRATHLDRAASADAPRAYLEAARAELREHRTSHAQRLLARGLELARAPAERIVLLEAKGAADLLLGEASASIAVHRTMAELARDDAERYRAEIGAAAALRVASRYDEALAALDRAEAAAARASLPAAQLHILRGNVYFATARLDECRRAHDEALALARRTGEVALEAQALSGLADAHYGAARLVSAARTWEACIALARTESLLAIEGPNLPMLAMMSVFLGETERAVELAAQAIALARRLSHKRAEVLARGAASLAANAAGDHEAGLVEARHAMALARALGTVVFEETAWYYASQALIGLGRRGEAREAAERGLALCREHGMFFLGATLLATVARLAEDRQTREALLAEGAAQIAQGGLSFNRFWYYENAIEEALASGDAARARSLAEALSRASEEPLPWVHAIVARARAA